MGIHGYWLQLPRKLREGGRREFFDSGAVEFPVARSTPGVWKAARLWLASMGAMSSDAGALLLGKADRAIGLVTRFAACFIDARASELIEHSLEMLVGQRLFGLAFGYEDLNDHDHLRHDPVMAVLAGKLEARRKSCAPVAGKSTLNRLEQACEERVPAYGSDRALFEVRTSGRRSSGAGPSQTKSTGTAPTGSACSTWSSPVPLTRRLR